MTAIPARLPHQQISTDVGPRDPDVTESLSGEAVGHEKNSTAGLLSARNLGIAAAVGAALIGGAVMIARHRGGGGGEQVVDGLRLLQNPKLKGGGLLGLGGPKWGTVAGGTVFGAVAADSTPRAVKEAVVQGGLGDCYAMAVQSATAHSTPAAIDSGVRVLPSGNIGVKLGIGEVAVTPELPIAQGGKLAYARMNPDLKALWPAYYEKAFAAQYRGGSYRALEGGWPSDAFNWMLGANPAKIPAPADMFADISARLVKGNPVAACSRSTATPAMEAAGVVGNHTYAVLKVTDEGGTQKIHLWNPWNKKHPEPLTHEQFASMFDNVASTDEYYYFGSRFRRKPH